MPPAFLLALSILYQIVDALSNIEFVATKIKILNLQGLWKFLEAGGNSIVFVAGTGWLGYLILRPERQQKSLQAKLQLELEILYEKQPPYEVLDQNKRLYRIGIRNNGGTTIRDVRVQLVKINGTTMNLLPMELRQSDDFEPRRSRVWRPISQSSPPPPDFRRSFNLNPGQMLLVDVVEKYEVEKNTNVILCLASHGLRNHIPDGSYELEMLITAENISPILKNLHVNVDESGRLHLVAA